MLTCEKAESMIDAYLDDDLTNDQKEEFLAHISSCDNCKAALDFAKNVKDTLSSLPEIEVPEGFLDGIHEKIKEDKKPNKVIHFRRYAGLAACLIIAAVVSQGPKMAEYLNNDNKGEIIPPAISTPVPATISEGDAVLTPEVSPKIRQAEKTPSSAPTTAPVIVNNEETEPENLNSDIAPANLEEDTTKRAYDTEMSKITVLVNAENIEKAKELSSLFAFEENGTYTLDKSSFELLKEAFSDEGIEFSLTEEPELDIIKFTISE